MKSIFKTILYLVLVVVAFEIIAKIVNLITNEQFLMLIKKTGLVALVIMILGLLTTFFYKKDQKE